MVDKDFVKFCDDLRKKGVTWSEVAYKYCREEGIYSFTYSADSIRTKCKRAKKRLLDASTTTMKEPKEITKTSEEKSVNFETGEVEAKTNIKGDATKMTPEDVLKELGYNPDSWKLRSLKVKTWDQAKKDDNTEVMSSVRYIIAPKNPELSIKDVIEVAKEVFAKEDLPKYVRDQKDPDKYLNTNKLLLVNQIELHIGKISEVEDTGVHYNTDVAMQRFNRILDETLKFQSKVQCNRALVVIGGDFFNSESDGHTFNKTPIQNDHRYKYLFKKGLQAYKTFLNALSMAVPKVTVMLCEGNHARSMEFYLYEVLKNYYEDWEGIEFIEDYKATQCRQWGDNALFFNHGDPDMKRLVASLPGEFSTDWGLTKNHYLFIGHFHKSEVSNNENGLQWIRIPAPCSNDEWTTRNRFGAGTRPSYQLMTFDLHDGLDLSKFIYFDEV